ncbi:cytochrome d ubiquinol oxidase subunit II [Mesorhizobium sp. B2-4-17]|uniref:cytochrome d ubiquinol oxidase subunit II n=1 Tax=Mesorhizobium sp. B2-4-17 TaxID=2589932 RepID=UPI0011274334|nr:cytochrome d ubiquinol oxidase subunit II [Mesorhizobium sp. B2-4-17]TPK78115.1 cytochrome d ubiquinol oxidase subunit II [Mesorhizobium sp. B2-4-17]
MIDLPLLSALFVAFALTFYVLLDGFDLGVGALLLLQPDEAVRDRMVASITPTWDGNETWLIMAGVGLLAGFPIAYGILLPAFYLPLIIMLLALGLRGVSFEFRVQQVAGRRRWDVAFGLGSILAALMQGLIVGGLIQGVAVNGEAFAGSVGDVFSPFPLLCAVALVAGYIVLGAGWLYMKGTGEMHAFAQGALRFALPITVFFAAAAWILAPFVQPAITEAWKERPVAFAFPDMVFLLAAGFCWMRVGRGADGAPFFAAIVMMLSGIGGLALVVFPDVVPFRLTLWQAASATESHIFLLIGAVVVTPVVLAYSAFAYYVFRGRTPETGWDT